MEDFYYEGKQGLRIETPESQITKLIVAVNLEGSYVSTDRGELRSHVEGG
jgi:hypothetical protein